NEHAQQDADKLINIIPQTCLDNIITVHRPDICKPVKANNVGSRRDTGKLRFVGEDPFACTNKLCPLSYSLHDSNHQNNGTDNTVRQYFIRRNVINQLPVNWEKTPKNVCCSNIKYAGPLFFIFHSSSPLRLQ